MGIVQRHATEDYVAENIQTALNDVNKTLNNTVSVVPQVLTDEQKQQAIKNIGVDTAIQQAISGFYSYGTEDLVAGESSLETGKLYFVIEE